MRISMLGQSGSGKTTYMCALHEAMINNEFCGFSIAPYSNDDKSLNSLSAIGKLENISFCRDGEHIQFPEGTSDTTYWSFDLLYRNNKLCKLDWIDYRGGRINEIFDGEEEALFLKDIIYASNAVIIFVDSIQIALNTNTNICKRITGADKLTLLLKDYERSYKNTDTVILLALSKCDSTLIPDDYKNNNYEKLITNCCLLFKDIIAIKNRNNRWHMGVVPISSVGNESTFSSKKETGNILKPFKVSCDLIRYPIPINIAETFLFCIKEIVNISKQYEYRKVSRLQEQVTKEFNQATLFNAMWATIQKKESHYTLARKLNESKIVSEDTVKQLDRILTLMEQTAHLERVHIL